MVLIDTSVWIRFLIGKAPYLDGVRELLSNRNVLGHDLIYGELLIGDTGARKTLLSAYEQIVRAQSVPHEELAAFVCNHNLQGCGIGWIDAYILAAALISRAKLWTADKSLQEVASRFEIEYRPPGFKLVH